MKRIMGVDPPITILGKVMPGWIYLIGMGQPQCPKFDDIERLQVDEHEVVNS